MVRVSNCATSLGTAKELYEAFVEWSIEDGVSEKRIMTQTTFGRRVGQLYQRYRCAKPGRPFGFAQGRPAAYRGVRLLPAL